MRLLVVEDHPELGPDLKAGLEQWHYAVDLVTNGEDAVAQSTAKNVLPGVFTAQ